MALSEDEVNELAKRVEADVEIDLETEVAWTRGQLDAAINTEKQQVMLFRLHKRLRNDDAMKGNEKSMIELRQIIKYCQERLEQLKAE